MPFRSDSQKKAEEIFVEELEKIALRPPSMRVGKSEIEETLRKGVFRVGSSGLRKMRTGLGRLFTRSHQRS